MAALGLSNKAVYEDDVINGPSAEPVGSVAMYTEVVAILQHSAGALRNKIFSYSC